MNPMAIAQPDGSAWRMEVGGYYEHNSCARPTAGAAASSSRCSRGTARTGPDRSYGSTFLAASRAQISWA